MIGQVAWSVVRDVWLGVGCTNFSFCGPKSVAKKKLFAAKTEIRTPDPSLRAAQ